MAEYEALKAAREMAAPGTKDALERIAQVRSGEKMTLQDFEKALHKLLDDAIQSGLPADDVQEVADAIVNNTFLDDETAI